MNSANNFNNFRNSISIIYLQIQATRLFTRKRSVSAITNTSSATYPISLRTNLPSICSFSTTITTLTITTTSRTCSRRTAITLTSSMMPFVSLLSNNLCQTGPFLYHSIISLEFQRRDLSPKRTNHLKNQTSFLFNKNNKDTLSIIYIEQR